MKENDMIILVERTLVQQCIECRIEKRNIYKKQQKQKRIVGGFGINLVRSDCHVK